MDTTTALAGAMEEIHANAKAMMLDSAMKLTRAINSDDPDFIDATLTVLPVTLKIAQITHRKEVACNESKVAV